MRKSSSASENTSFDSVTSDGSYKPQDILFNKKYTSPKSSMNEIDFETTDELNNKTRGKTFSSDDSNLDFYNEIMPKQESCDNDGVKTKVLFKLNFKCIALFIFFFDSLR